MLLNPLGLRRVAKKLSPALREQLGNTVCLKWRSGAEGKAGSSSLGPAEGRAGILGGLRQDPSH